MPVIERKVAPPASAEIGVLQEVTYQKIVGMGVAPARVRGLSFGEMLFRSMKSFTYSPNDNYFEIGIDERELRWQELVENLTQAEADNYIDWLKDGGYDAAKKRYDERKAKIEAARKDTLMVAPGEELSIDFDDDTLAALKPRSELAPEHELEQVVDELLLSEDKRYGSW